MALKKLNPAQMKFLRECKYSKNKLDRWVYRNMMKKLKKRGKYLYIEE
jgi:hypothetical protein